MKRIISLAAICCFVVGSIYAACTGINVSYLTSGLSPMTTDNEVLWTWHSNYNCGYGTAFNKGVATGTKAHLFTPEFDFSDAQSVTISFDHAHKFGETSNIQQDYTLWVTADYKGTFAASTWKQLTIPTYGTNDNWKYVTATIEVPTSYLGTKTVFALQYNNGSSTGTWQVKNLTIQSTCAGGGMASPVPVPEVGEARLKVVGQNLKNYYFNYNEGRGNYTPAQFAEKTRKLVNAMMMLDADVFAFCEVEAQPEVLVQLADSMNKRVESKPYVAVSDNAVEAWDATYDNNLKSGFIYRKDKVKPYGDNHAATSANYYKNTLRIQVFEELETGERFTLSMNHFKAKNSKAETDDSNETRKINANQMISGLNTYASDPDILILGDFNCQIGEDPITIIENAGYEELTVKYDASAYSHCFGDGELIDHVFANASMAEQITGVGVFHISTECGEYEDANAGYRYSDHDPYMVGVNLTIHQTGECEDLNATLLSTGGSSFSPMVAENISGKYAWQYDATYGAKCTDQGGLDWLITPTYNMAQSKDISLSFSHAINYANVSNMSNEHTLWVTKDYQGSAASSEWEQLTIPTYPTGTNWKFVSAKVNVPESKVGANTAFAFKYAIPEGASNKPTWEIKNLVIKATCKTNAIGHVSSEQRAQKTIENGALYLTLPDGAKYNVIGIRIR